MVTGMGSLCNIISLISNTKLNNINKKKCCQSFVEIPRGLVASGQHLWCVRGRHLAHRFLITLQLFRTEHLWASPPMEGSPSLILPYPHTPFIIGCDPVYSFAPWLSVSLAGPRWAGTCASGSLLSLCLKHTYIFLPCGSGSDSAWPSLGSDLQMWTLFISLLPLQRTSNIQ